MAKKKNEEKFNYNESVRRLKDEGPQRMYLIWGDEDYLSGLFFEEIKKLCVTDEKDDFSYRKLTEQDFSAQKLIEAVDCVPFLSERTLVEVRGVNLNRLEEPDAVLDALKDIPDYCTVVFINDNTFEPDKRLKFYKSFLKKCVEIHTTAQPGAQLINWIVKRFSAAGKEIELNAAQRLISVSGDLMNSLIPEINKVASYSKGKKVSVEDVEAVAHHIPEAVVFDMTECLAKGENNAAMAHLAELLADKNNEPIMMLAMIGMQMRKLYAARVAIDNNLGKDYIMKTCGIRFDFVVTKLIISARRYTTERLKRAVELCAETDYAMKSSGTDPVELLKECVMRIASGEENA